MSSRMRMVVLTTDEERILRQLAAEAGCTLGWRQWLHLQISKKRKSNKKPRPLPGPGME